MGKLLIKNGKVYVNKELKKVDILIDQESGKIEKIGKVDFDGNTYDASGLIVLPGLIDCHVHFREPGFEYKEDFLTGSYAAAAGGITTVIDMPNNKPPILTIANLKNKRNLAKKSVVNYGFHFGSSIDNISEIEKAKNVPCVASTKIFLDISTGKMVLTDDKVLEDIFKSSKIVTVHAEGPMVEKAVALAKKTNRNIYLCHISQASEIEYIKSNKAKNIFVELTPHHLFLDDDGTPFTKMKPELHPEDRYSLWAALNDGLVDTIGTDHAPHTIEDKKRICFGIPGEETMLPLLLDAVNKKQLSLKQIVKLTSENPASIFKIRNRGKIKEGFYADLVIIDIDKIRKVDNKKLYTKCKWSPWNGKKLKGWPITTLVNGNIIFDNGKIYDIKAKEIDCGR